MRRLDGGKYIGKLESTVQGSLYSNKLFRHDCQNFWRMDVRLILMNILYLYRKRNASKMKLLTLARSKNKYNMLRKEQTEKELNNLPKNNRSR
jgi:hypothetical protein